MLDKNAYMMQYYSYMEINMKSMNTTYKQI